MKTRILAIAPYPGMKELMLDVAAGWDEIDLHVEVGDLEQGLKAFQNCCADNYDIVVSRGGTSQLIRRNSDMPVIDVSITEYDVLCAIKMANSVDSPFAIIGYSGLTDCAKDLCRVMQYDIPVFTLTPQMDVHAQLSHLAAQGIETFVCDMIASTVAQEMGLNAILVLSGTESITNVFNQAIHLSRAHNYLRRQREMLKIIFAESEQNVCVYYPDGRLWFSTLSKEDEIKMDRKIHEKFIPFQQEEDYTEEYSEENVLHCFHFRSIEAFGQNYVMVFYMERELFSANENTEDEAAFDEHSEQASEIIAGAYLGDGALRQKILSYAKTSYPIFIAGEGGCRKSQIAALIHKQSPYRDGHYYIINCAALNPKRWSFLLNNCESPFFDAECTIFFRNAENLDEVQISRLTEFLSQGTTEENVRLIFSVNADSPSYAKNLSLLQAALQGIQLNVPPLRTRRNEINTMAIMDLNYMNRELGKEIIGFEKEAIDLLRAFPWPHNMRQFQRIVRQISVMTTGNYVTAETVREALSLEEDAFPRAVSNGIAEIDISRPLEEIEVSIVKAVLEHNNMNQTRTAEQLKISRSKLWRMLK